MTLKTARTVFGTDREPESLFSKIKKDKNRTGTGTEVSFYPKNHRTGGSCSFYFIIFTLFFNFLNLLRRATSPNTPYTIVYSWLASGQPLRCCF